MNHVLDNGKVSVQPQTVEIFDPLKLGEWVFGNRLRLVTAPTPSRHVVLQRWQLIYGPCKSGLIHRLNQFSLEIIMLLALVMVAIDACSNYFSNCAA